MKHTGIVLMVFGMAALAHSGFTYTTRGQELGSFQFGRSTHGVNFRPGVIRAFRGQGNSPDQVGQVMAFAHASEA